jgi:hypothetical protein
MQYPWFALARDLDLSYSCSIHKHLVACCRAFLGAWFLPLQQPDGHLSRPHH